MKKVSIYNPYLDTRGGGEKVCLALASALKNNLGYDVSIISHSDIDLEPLGSYFNIDLSGIRVETVNFDSFFSRIMRRLPLPGRIKNVFYDSKVIKKIKSGNYDLFINNCYQSNLPSPLKNSVYMCMFPQKLTVSKKYSFLKRVYVRFAIALHRALLHPWYKNPIDTYRVITANSHYTQNHIAKMWGKKSEILFPVCDDISDSKIVKQKKIVSLGRFFEDNGDSHHKRHDVLVETFSKMHHLQNGGWELHLIGSVAEDTGTLKYILSLIELAKDSPIYFHFNSSYADLKKTINEASIYWHATGYGSDPEKYPEKQEHFGISTVEAMSTGAIPIVINSAGQKESVIQGENGFLWNTVEELKNYTISVADMPDTKRLKIAKQSKHDAKKYNRDAFIKNVHDIFDHL